MYPYFSTEQLLPLYPAVIFLFLSMIAFEKKWTKSSLSLLFLGTLALGCFIALLDPFLILWDEQYHALVAKNMMEHPFKPMLYSNPILGYDYNNWTANHIWLHKQPLFLWQMALSLKLFGLNAFAIRIPSIILHALIPLLIYRIGKIAIDKRTGYYGALFFAVAYFPLELVAGRYSTDHNDIAFLFYVTASIWAWFEYQHSQKFYWVILIGVFSGCAVLVKWLLGLLIYAPWGISILTNKEQRTSPESYTHYFGSFLISLLVFLPWQFFILKCYPVEAHYEIALNTSHLHTAIEGHSGSVWYHFIALRTLYGQGQAVPFLLLIGMILLYIKTPKTTYKIGLLLTPVLIYGFYAIVATKMLSFCIIASPMIFLGMSALLFGIIDQVIKWIKKPNLLPYLTIVLALLLVFFNLDLRRIQGYHTPWKPNDNCNREAEMTERRGIKALQQANLDEKYVVFNAQIRVNGHIPVMFYTNHVAYNYIPSQEQLNLLYLKGYKPAIYNIGQLPDYIKNDSTIKIIQIPK